MDKRYWGAVLLIFIFLVMIGSAKAACNNPYPGTGDWIIDSTNSPLECNDTGISLKGNLTIQADGEAVFDNVTLSIDPFMRIGNEGEFNVNSSNFTGSGVNPYSIVSKSGSYLTLENSDISGFSSFEFSGTAANLFGNRISGMSNPVFTVSNALIEGNNFTGSCIETSGTGNIILDNRMEDVTVIDGCVFRGDQQRIEGNTFDGVSYGIHYFGERSLITENNMTGDGYGFVVNGSHNVIEKANVTIDNAYSSMGFVIEGTNITFNNNYIYGCTAGLGLVSSDGAKVTNSDFISNDIDISAYSTNGIDFTGTNYVIFQSMFDLIFSVKDVNGTGIESASVKLMYNNQTMVKIFTDENGTVNTPAYGFFENTSNPNMTGWYVYDILVEKEGYAPASLSHNLTDDVNLNVTLTSYDSLNPFELVIESPDNRTYLSDDPAITGSALRAVITSNLNMSGCNHTIRGEKTIMTKLNSNTFESWFDVTGYAGAYTIDFSCRSDDGRISSESLTFSMFESYTCLSDDDCSDDMKCIRNQCQPVNCPCGEISNHTCTEYECCEDTDCGEEEECDLSSHECRDVVCTCGYIEDHECKREPGYCCTDAHCGENQVCDVENNECIRRTIDIEVEGDLWVGGTVKVFAIDQGGDAVQGVGITVVYVDSGNSEMFFTSNISERGYCAEIPIKEQGEVRFTARKSGYETGTTTETASVEIFSLILPVVIIIVLIPLIFFLYRTFRKPSALKLGKKISGQNVTIKIKNRSRRNLSDIQVFDTLPRNSLRGAAMIPRLEKKDSRTDYLVWHILRLKPGEEVEISYTADRPVKGFTVKTGGKEYKG